jgi:hypothetical protein
LTNPQAVEFAIAQILKVPPYPDTRAAPVRRTRPLGKDANQLLASWKGTAGTGNERILEDVVVEAIRQSGVSIASQSGGPGRGFDLAVWSEDLEPWVSNPLLIELKASIGSEAALEDVILNLARTMGGTGVQWALLIYGDSPLAPDKVVGPPNILAISAEEFLRALETRSFGELVRTLRNERVHGVR